MLTDRFDVRAMTILCSKSGTFQMPLTILSYSFNKEASLFLSEFRLTDLNSVMICNLKLQ